MENVVLTIHLILALLLIGVVLLQRSEGGGLGMGSGGGGAMSGRGVATAMTKLTWIFAAGFIITSITLTILAAQKAGNASVVDQFGGTPAAQPVSPADPLGTDLLPPTNPDAPVAPPRLDDAPAVPETAPETAPEPATPAPAPVAPAPAPAAPAN